MINHIEKAITCYVRSDGLEFWMFIWIKSKFPLPSRNYTAFHELTKKEPHAFLWLHSLFGYLDNWIVLGHKTVDPIKDFGDVNPARIANAGAIVVGHVRVDRQDGVRAAQEIGTAGVAEACAALILSGIE